MSICIGSDCDMNLYLNVVSGVAFVSDLNIDDFDKLVISAFDYWTASDELNVDLYKANKFCFEYFDNYVECIL